jgi:hypothetical protein
MKLLKQASAVVCIVSLFACSGCTGSTGMSLSAAYNTQTGATTITTTVSGTITFGGAKANFVSNGDPTTYSLVNSIPSEFTPNASSPPQVTLTATTDTGYVSSITLTLQPTSTTVGPVNQGDVVYAYSVPASTALTTWEQNVGANTTEEAQVSAVSTLPLTSSAITGTYQVNAIAQTPSGSSNASTSISLGLSGPSNPLKCPENPSCPVRIDELPSGN